MKKLFFFSFVLLIVFYSCKKKKKGCMDPISISYDADAEEDDKSCIYGGTGGNVTIVARPEHHGVPITSKVNYPDSAFLKFNAQDSPGSDPSLYDYHSEGEEGEDHVHLYGIRPGKYFIYMTGMDSTGPYRVYGGIPIIITQTSGEFNVTVPIAE
jgi:hypothetical protein